MSFAEMLTAWMAANRYNNADAADALGVAASTVGRWVAGKNGPDIKRAAELAEVFDVPATDVALAIVRLATSAGSAERIEALLAQVIRRQDELEQKLLDLAGE